MTVGTELKQARENAGLSPEQISERTKIQLYKIDAVANSWDDASAKYFGDGGLFDTFYKPKR